MPRIAHLSDTHLGAVPKAVPRAVPRAGYRKVDPLLRLEEVVDWLGVQAPFDAVVVTGDITDNGSELWAEQVRDLVSELAPEVYAVPGNHDDPTVIADVFGSAQGRIGSWQVAGAVSCLPGEVHGSAVPVVEALQHHSGREPLLLLTHHPLRSRSTHPMFVLDEAESLESFLRARDGGPLIILSGHTHETFEDEVHGARLIGAPSTFYGIDHDGEEYTVKAANYGALVLTLQDDGRVQVESVTG